jgi:hypothetical protein
VCALAGLRDGGASAPNADAGAPLAKDAGQSSGSPTCPPNDGNAAGPCVPVGCSTAYTSVLDFLDANKDCVSVADCQTSYGGCGVSEDGCTGAVYINQAADLATLAALRDDLTTCSTDSACVVCERESAPPTCLAGRCVNADACGSAQDSLLRFIDSNKECTTGLDCMARIVGCGVTEDGCTGAVYLNEAAEASTFEALRDDFMQCVNGRACVTCDRNPGPADCVSGRCSNGL